MLGVAEGDGVVGEAVAVGEEETVGVGVDALGVHPHTIRATTASATARTNIATTLARGRHFAFRGFERNLIRDPCEVHDRSGRAQTCGDERREVERLGRLVP